MTNQRRVVTLPNWFASTPALENFKNLLTRMAGKPGLQFLQLGAFTGDASAWLLDNILTDKTSHLTDVDTWGGSDEKQHREMDFSEVEYAYDYKTKKYKNLTKVKNTTVMFLRQAPLDFYDFVYIDADHTAVSVILDAELSWLCLKSGGVLAFDDYQWTDGKADAYRPGPGIDLFLDRHKDELNIINKGWQLWVVKK